jgi:hypothetical protein
MNNDSYSTDRKLKQEQQLWKQVEHIFKPSYFGLCRNCEFCNICAVPGVDGGTWDCNEYDDFVEEKERSSSYGS